MEQGWLAAKTCHRSQERRLSGAQTHRSEESHQARSFRREQLAGALSRRKASGADIQLTNAGFAWLRKSVMTDEVTAAVNPHNLLLDRA